MEEETTSVSAVEVSGFSLLCTTNHVEKCPFSCGKTNQKRVCATYIFSAQPSAFFEMIFVFVIKELKLELAHAFAFFGTIDITYIWTRDG